MSELEKELNTLWDKHFKWDTGNGGYLVDDSNSDEFLKELNELWKKKINKALSIEQQRDSNTNKPSL